MTVVENQLGCYLFTPGEYSDLSCLIRVLAVHMEKAPSLVIQSAQYMFAHRTTQPKICVPPVLSVFPCSQATIKRTVKVLICFVFSRNGSNHFDDKNVITFNVAWISPAFI